MAHETVNFDHLLGKLKGLSDKQLQAHFGLYQGYVKKLNEIEDKLKTVNKDGGNYSFNEFSELLRRYPVAFNGAYLHQLYFENLSGEGGEASAEVKAALDANFGSWDNFIADMKGAATSTPGWVLLTWDKVDKRLHHCIAFEHHIGLPVHHDIVLALDCWEHAFMIDYGTNKGDYLKAFLDNVNWDIVNKRFKQSSP